MGYKNDDKQDDLKFDAIIFDEVIQFEDMKTMKIKEQMGQQKVKK